MKISKHIKFISIWTILRSSFILFMCLYMSVAQLTYLVDFLDATEMELVEESDIEQEEKNEKEEVEKDEFLNKLILYTFQEQEKLQVLHAICWNWSVSGGEIPTPPPKFI